MSSLLLAFCFLLVCVVDETQLYPSPISPLGLFQEIVCNIHSVNVPPYLYGLGFSKDHRRGDQLLQAGGIGPQLALILNNFLL